MPQSVGGPTPPGHPGAFLGRIDDLDRGGNTFTTTRGRWDNSRAHAYRPYHRVPRPPAVVPQKQSWRSQFQLFSQVDAPNRTAMDPKNGGYAHQEIGTTAVASSPRCPPRGVLGIPPPTQDTLRVLTPPTEHWNEPNGIIFTA